MGKPKIGFVAGTWDFVHAGHVALFEKCKEYCDYLIVGLQIDPSKDRPKKNKPIMSLEEREKMLRGNKWIDAIIIYEREIDLIRIEKWLPVDFRFSGVDHKGEPHYVTKGKFMWLDGDQRFHSSEIRKRCQMS